MFLLAGGVVMIVVSNVLCTGTKNGEDKGYQIPNSYIDVFKAGMDGKPTLGTGSATCWARGGICVHINSCPSLHMDVGVAGCSRGFMVCCKLHVLGSPTVGTTRRNPIPHINSLDELGAALDIIAWRNSMLLSGWTFQTSDTDDNVKIYLGHLMN